MSTVDEPYSCNNGSVFPGHVRVHVEFLAPDGTVWMAREVAGSMIVGARGPRCLVFANEWAMRMVWTYPDDWAACTSAALFDLSWQR
jgi:hypothetical protein